MDINQLEKLPSKIETRVIGFYLYQDKIRYWNGKILLCQHKSRQNVCKSCKGKSICQHGKRFSRCSMCEGGGSSLCEHKVEKHNCSICKGTSICQHGKRKYTCTKCKGTGICEHGRRRNICIQCNGSQVCQHQKIRWTCDACNPEGHLVNLVRRRIRHALDSNNKDKSSMEYVGCDVKTLQEYLQSKFLEGMSWDNKSEWHIDHIKPCSSFDLSDPYERIKCFHYTNLQPLWIRDNLSKGTKYDPENDTRVWDEESQRWK